MSNDLHVMFNVCDVTPFSIGMAAAEMTSEITPWCIKWG